MACLRTKVSRRKVQTMSPNNPMQRAGIDKVLASAPRARVPTRLPVGADGGRWAALP